MILIQQYQYQSPAGDSVPSNECTKDQSAPWIGAMFVDAGGLGPGSYGESQEPALAGDSSLRQHQCHCEEGEARRGNLLEIVVTSGDCFG